MPKCHTPFWMCSSTSVSQLQHNTTLSSGRVSLNVAQQKVRQAEERTPAYHGILKISCLFVSFLHLLYMLNPKVLLCYLQELSCRGEIIVLFCSRPGKEQNWFLLKRNVTSLTWMSTSE